MAMNANRTTGLVRRKNQKTTEKLSSGYRINWSADDAAGLAISEKMRRQIRGLSQASSNAQDGISLVQVADGALHEMHAIVQRGNELAVKAANGTLTDEERLMVDTEIQQLKQALNESAHTTTFNEIKLFPEDGQSPKAAMNNQHYPIHSRTISWQHRSIHVRLNTTVGRYPTSFYPAMKPRSKNGNYNNHWREPNV